MIELTPMQHKANAMMASSARHILLRGGSRSGKTFVFCRGIVIRACKAGETSHTILRQKFNHLKHSVIGDTMPRVIRECFPELPLHDRMLNKTDWFLELPNKSRIVYGGLDDKERTEKILGQEHATIMLNECSQIAYASRNKAVTRLAQKCALNLKAYYDCNPPKMGHWTYRMFMKKIEPESGAALPNPDAYATMRLNPYDNIENLGDGYIQELEALPAKDRKRFLEGEFAAATAGALWTDELLDKRRVSKDQLPTMKRIVIAVDPSGCSGEEDERSDEVGIAVCGLGQNGKGYLLADYSDRHSPEGWARAVVNAFYHWEADLIVGEKNYGGDLVAANVRAFDHKVPFKLVTASRGKAVRAEPISNLYETSKIFHCGIFPDLEEQMCNFSTSGYEGDTSPDRADAMVWGFSELFFGKAKYGMMGVA